MVAVGDREGEMMYTKRFEDAFVYAVHCHGGQLRKGTSIPYINHLMSVAAIVGENGGTEDEVIAALLHDAPEDQGGEVRLEDIRGRFGAVVAEIVDGCSDTFEDPKPPFRERKEAYLKRIRNKPAHVRLISAADKLANARSILADLRVLGDRLFERFNGGKDGTLWYYRELVEQFRLAGTNAIVEEFARVVEEIEEFTETPASAEQVGV